MTTITEPTVLYDLDEAAYHADQLCPEPSLSSTMAKTILEPGGPARLRSALDSPRESNPNFDFGSAAHEKILGRGQPVVAIDGNRNTKAVKEEVAAAEADGFLVLKSHEVAAVDAMAEAILQHPIAADLLTAGKGNPEVSMFGIDEETGRWMRGRLDFLHSRKLIVDYKTTASANPRDFERSSWNFGYHVQAAHYQYNLARQLDLVDDDCAYVLIAQEKKAPFLPVVYQLDPGLLDYGRERAREAIDLWDRCLTLDEWPGIEPIIHTLSIPRWAVSDTEKENQ